MFQLFQPVVYRIAFVFVANKLYGSNSVHTPPCGGMLLLCCWSWDFECCRPDHMRTPHECRRDPKSSSSEDIKVNTAFFLHPPLAVILCDAAAEFDWRGYAARCRLLTDAIVFIKIITYDECYRIVSALLRIQQFMRYTGRTIQRRIRRETKGFVGQNRLKSEKHRNRNTRASIITIAPISEPRRHRCTSSKYGFAEHNMYNIRFRVIILSPTGGVQRSWFVFREFTNRVFHSSARFLCNTDVVLLNVKFLKGFVENWYRCRVSTNSDCINSV